MNSLTAFSIGAVFGYLGLIEAGIVGWILMIVFAFEIITLEHLLEHTINQRKEKK